MHSIERARPIQAYLLLLCGCMSVLAAVVIAPVLPKMQAHFAALAGAEYLVPLALTTPGLVIGLLSVPIGLLADRVGRKQLLIGGLSLYALFGMAPLWLDSLYPILGTRLGVGFSEAVIMTCCTALIGDYFQGLQRERYLALNTTFASSSAVIFIAIGGVLGEFGWRVPFAVYGVSLLLACAAVLLLWEPPRRQPGATAHMVSVATPELVWRPWLLLGICLVTLFGGVMFMAVQVHIGYLLERVGVTSSSTVGLIAAVAQLAVVVGSLFFRLLLRQGMRVSLRLALAMCGTGLGFMLVGSASDLVGVAVGAVVAGFGGGILLPTLLCWNMNHLSGARRALGTGAWMAAFFLGQFLTPLVVVGIAGTIGGIGAAINLLGMLVLPVGLALLLCALLGRRCAPSTLNIPSV